MPVSLRVFLAGLCALAALAMAVGLIAAQEPVLWADEGVEVCGAENWQANVHVAADGAGGAIIAWDDQRNVGTTGMDIYAQRVNALGRPLWRSDGVTVCEAAHDGREALVVSDGERGAIIVWRDYRSGSQYDIYAQRVLSDGTMAWAADGISVCTESGDKEYVDAASDQKGGVLITWQDKRGAPDDRVYAQRLDGDGNKLWYTGGLTICDQPGVDCDDPVIAPDGRGGAYVAWHDYRSGDNDVYAQFVWADGDFDNRWYTVGEKVATKSARRTDPKIAFDGDDSALVVWRDYDDDTDGDVRIQKMDWAGVRTWDEWEGEVVCEASGTQYHVEVASDGEGGALVARRDQRDEVDGDIYARRVFFNGTPLWITDGVSLCTKSGAQSHPLIVSDGDGGALAVWMDDYKDLYAQKVNRSGVILWEQGGISVRTELTQTPHPDMAFDGVMGAVVAWHEWHGTDYDIYAQRVGITDVGLPLVMKP